jgi:hypothetical protein
MKKILLTLTLVATLISCKQPILKDGTEPEVKEVKEKPLPKKVVVVQKISLSNGKYQEFIVSGKGFKFETKELTFGVRDTIVIQGDYVYPKSDSTQTIKKNWL